MGPIADLKGALDLSTLENTSILVTGGASGLGSLIASAFASNGARVTVADINEERGKAFVDESKAKGYEINFVATDVTDWTSQVKAFKSSIAFSRNQAIDVVVASAGVPGASFTSPEDEEASLDKDPQEPPLAGPTFDVNAKAVYFTSKLAQHYFGLPPSPLTRHDKAPRKSLILLSSLAGYLELNAADYTASKWAVRGVFRSIRSKMEDLGYRTNLIAPWVMDTPMAKQLAELCRQQGFPVGDANDVAAIAVRCASDDSICGRAIAVGSAEVFDLRDDFEGLGAGIQMRAYLDGEAKEFMAYFGQRV